MSCHMDPMAFFSVIVAVIWWIGLGLRMRNAKRAPKLKRENRIHVVFGKLWNNNCLIHSLFRCYVNFSICLWQWNWYLTSVQWFLISQSSFEILSKKWTGSLEKCMWTPLNLHSAYIHFGTLLMCPLTL